MKRRDFLKATPKGVASALLLASFPALVRANTNQTNEGYYITIDSNPAKIEGFDIKIFLNPLDITGNTANSSDKTARIEVIQVPPLPYINKASVSYKIKNIEKKEGDIYQFKLKLDKIENNEITLQEMFKNDLNWVELSTLDGTLTVRNSNGGAVLLYLLHSTKVQESIEEDEEDDFNPYEACFLTTACVEYKGLEDNCEELTKLRFLRDNFILKQDGGKELILDYYNFAPHIIKTINQLENKQDFYNHIYDNLVKPSVHLIDKGEYNLASDKYKEYVEVLNYKLFN